ncbi:MAG: VWA domain-containing protein [Oscillochloridaceae bacterium]|nr:VWA domain-containing protein [Chloroflexaceae bacterium]MDW8392006.1 VWA domain-containing protein [Oscillochloridaceae bacterium]
MMDVPITRFVALLKRHGIAVSPAEAIDALQGLALAGIDDRETVRVVLRSTLVKQCQAIAEFDRLFDLYFSLPAPAEDGSPEERSGAGSTLLPDAGGATVPTPEGARAELAPVEMETDRTTRAPVTPEYKGVDLSLFGQHLLLQQRKDAGQNGYKPTFHVNARHNPGMPAGGELSTGDPGEEIDLGGAVEALLADLRALEVDEALLEQLEARLAGGLTRLPELLRRYRVRDAALHRARDPAAAPPRATRRTYRFNDHERRQMDEIIRRLGRQMRGALSYRKTANRRGRINVSRTIRGNLKYDGVPFFPVLSNQREERPRLTVICDVSLSVRTTARFMLHLVYSLQSLFSRVRSFVFVSDLAEISAEIERSSLEETIDRVFSGEIINTEENSNYGRALEIFYERYRSAATSRTTLIILGDGRGNRNPPNAWILEELRRRCKQVIWLTPESRGSWHIGASDMPTYAPICHKVEVVRNLDQLGRVAESLVRSSFANRR